MDYNFLLMQNKMLQPADKVVPQWKETKQDPNQNLAQTMHDEAIASNPNVYKPGSEEILHMNSLDRLMRGNIDPDTALQQKLELEKKDMLGAILKESSLIENGIVAGATSGVSTGTPIAPMNATPYKKPKSKSLTMKIENAYKLRKSKDKS